LSMTVTNTSPRKKDASRRIAIAPSTGRNGVLTLLRDNGLQACDSDSAQPGPVMISQLLTNAKSERIIVTMETPGVVSNHF